MWATIGTIAGAILAPLLGLIITRYLQKLKDAAMAEQRQKQEAAQGQQAGTALSDRDQSINHSIDAQREARERWKRGDGGPSA